LSTALLEDFPAQKLKMTAVILKATVRQMIPQVIGFKNL
jgi:hypothetical protein